VRPTNGYAITALVSSLVLAPLGIVFGHLALKQIKRTGESGRGLAIGGLAIGYVMTCISVISIVVFVGFVGKVADIATGGERYPSETDFSKVDPDSLTVDQFYDDTVYPQEYRIKWADTIIRPREQQAYDRLNSLITGHGFPPLSFYTNSGLVEPSVDNTGDQLGVQQSVIAYIASTDPLPDRGRKLLAAAFEGQVLENVLAHIGAGKEPIEDFFGVSTIGDNYEKEESPVFKHSAVGDYVPNDVPSKVFNRVWVLSPSGVTDRSQAIVRFVAGRWIVHESIKPGNPNWVTYPAQIHDK